MIQHSKIRNKVVSVKIKEARRVRYDCNKHIRLGELGYKTIYQICDLSKKRWEEYFNKGGGIYLLKSKSKEFVPSYQQILFNKSAVNILSKGSLKPVKIIKPKRKYVKSDLTRKAGGLNLYLQKNDKFTKNDRLKLFSLAENYISKYNSLISISQQTNHLDSNLSDLENLDIWNNFFLSAGPLIPELTESYLKHIGFNSNDKNELDNFSDEENIRKIEKLSELKSKKSKYVDLGF